MMVGRRGWREIVDGFVKIHSGLQREVDVERLTNITMQYAKGSTGSQMGSVPSRIYNILIIIILVIIITVRYLN